MDKKDFTRSCKYYDGRGATRLSGNKAMLWNCERTWVSLSVAKSKVLADMLDDYLDVGLREFCQYDDTPITLKAVLYNSFAKYHSGTAQEAVEAFKVFYAEHYP